MISQHTLDLIVDTSISQTYTVRVSFDADNTPEMIGPSGKIFAPAELTISWVKPNGGVWRAILITLSGEDGNGSKSWAPEDLGIPQWVWDVVSETKPKE